VRWFDRRLQVAIRRRIRGVHSGFRSTADKSQPRVYCRAAGGAGATFLFFWFRMPIKLGAEFGKQCRGAVEALRAQFAPACGCATGPDRRNSALGQNLFPPFFYTLLFRTSTLRARRPFFLTTRKEFFFLPSAAFDENLFVASRVIFFFHHRAPETLGRFSFIMLREPDDLGPKTRMSSGWKILYPLLFFLIFSAGHRVE